MSEGRKDHLPRPNAMLNSLEPEAWEIGEQTLAQCQSSSVLGDSPGKNTGVGCHALLQGIFPTQESNPGLPHCRQILYHLSHQGSP